MFGKLTPAMLWDEEVTKHALDELFQNARQYQSSESYGELVDFIARFPSYAPYNGLLLHIQRPGAVYVASAHRWMAQYGRFIKPGARPLVILQRGGPVMFVFDVTDTEPGKNSQPLPREIEKPFEVRRGRLGGELERMIGNVVRDGVRVQFGKEGSQAAGFIRAVFGGHLPLQFRTGEDKEGNPIYAEIPLKYDLLVNEDLNREARFATITHELGHLYCGHLGIPSKKWKGWPDRMGLLREVAEFEAESISYLVCQRLHVDNPSEVYLATFMEHNQEIPSIRIELVMKAAGYIEQMGRQRLKLRKGQG